MTDTDRAALRAEYAGLRRWLWGILAAVIIGGLGALVQGGAALERLNATARLAAENAERITIMQQREAARDAAAARLEERLGGMQQQLSRIERALERLMRARSE